MTSENWASMCNRFNAGRSSDEFLFISVIFKKISMPKKVQFLYELYEEDRLLPRFERKSGKSVTLAAKYRKEGNYKFCNKQYGEALKLYTKSVAIAPMDSDELALAFSNRSAALFWLEKFAASLKDVNRSLKLEHPAFLESKLQRRKNECIARIRCETANESCMGNKPDINPEMDFDDDVGKIDHDWKLPVHAVDFKNELIPFVSEKIKLVQSEEMGRHMVAVHDILPGELLISARPYAVSLFPEFYHTHCSNCCKQCENLIPCESCSLVMFCGDRCRNEALDRYHRLECEILSFALTLEEKKDLLALRLLMIITKQGAELCRMMKHSVFGDPFEKKGFNVDEIFHSDDNAIVHNLVDNFERMPAQEKFERAAMAAMLLHILKQSTYFDEVNKELDTPIANDRKKLTDVECFVGALVLKYLCVVECNGHYYGEQEETPKMIFLKYKFGIKSPPVGVAVCPLLCFINHSCNSNVFTLTADNRDRMYSVQPIAKGEQLFCDYGAHYLAETKAERQGFLKYHFFFECNCEPCKWNWPLYAFLPQRNPKYLTKNVDVEELKKSSKRFCMLMAKLQAGLCVEEEWDFFCKHLELLHKNIRKPWLEYADCQEIVKFLIFLRFRST